MEIFTIGIFIAVAIALFFIGNTIKDFLLIFGSASILLLVGISLFATGYTIESGITETYNLTESNNLTTGTIEKVAVFESEKDLVTKGIGSVFFLVAIYLIVVCWDLYKRKQDNEGSLIDDVNL